MRPAADSEEHAVHVSTCIKEEVSQSSLIASCECAAFYALSTSDRGNDRHHLPLAQ